MKRLIFLSALLILSRQFAEANTCKAVTPSFSKVLSCTAAGAPMGIFRLSIDDTGPFLKASLKNVDEKSLFDFDVITDNEIHGGGRGYHENSLAYCDDSFHGSGGYIRSDGALDGHITFEIDSKSFRRLSDLTTGEKTEIQYWMRRACSGGTGAMCNDMHTLSCELATDSKYDEELESNLIRVFEMEKVGSTSETALGLAALAAKPAMLRKLLDLGADPNKKGSSGYSAMMRVANDRFKNEQEELDALVNLLEKNGDPNTILPSSGSPLIFFYIGHWPEPFSPYNDYRSNLEAMKALLLRGANPNLLSKYDRTPLTYSIQVILNGRGIGSDKGFEAFDILIKENADVNFSSPIGYAASGFCSSTRYHRYLRKTIIKKLIEAGAIFNKPYENGGSPMHTLISSLPVNFGPDDETRDRWDECAPDLISLIKEISPLKSLPLQEPRYNVPNDFNRVLDKIFGSEKYPIGTTPLTMLVVNLFFGDFIYENRLLEALLEFEDPNYKDELGHSAVDYFVKLAPKMDSYWSRLDKFLKAKSVNSENRKKLLTLLNCDSAQTFRSYNVISEEELTGICKKG